MDLQDQLLHSLRQLIDEVDAGVGYLIALDLDWVVSLHTLTTRMSSAALH